MLLFYIPLFIKYALKNTKIPMVRSSFRYSKAIGKVRKKAKKERSTNITITIFVVLISVWFAVKTKE